MPSAVQAGTSAMSQALHAAEVVALCNVVLGIAGLTASVKTIEEALMVCASTSALVAATEAVLRRQLPAIHRRPATAQERAANIDVALAELQAQLQTDLQHIKGANIVNGRISDIMDMLELLAALGGGGKRVTRAPGTAPKSLPSQRAQPAPPASPPTYEASYDHGSSPATEGTEASFGQGGPGGSSSRATPTRSHWPPYGAPPPGPSYAVYNQPAPQYTTSASYYPTRPYPAMPAIQAQMAGAPYMPQHPSGMMQHPVWFQPVPVPVSLSTAPAPTSGGPQVPYEVRYVPVHQPEPGSAPTPTAPTAPPLSAAARPSSAAVPGAQGTQDSERGVGYADILPAPPHSRRTTADSVTYEEAIGLIRRRTAEQGKGAARGPADLAPRPNGSEGGQGDQGGRITSTSSASTSRRTTIQAAPRPASARISSRGGAADVAGGDADALTSQDQARRQSAGSATAGAASTSPLHSSPAVDARWARVEAAAAALAGGAYSPEAHRVSSRRVSTQPAGKSPPARDMDAYDLTQVGRGLAEATAAMRQQSLSDGGVGGPFGYVATLLQRVARDSANPGLVRLASALQKAQRASTHAASKAGARPRRSGGSGSASGAGMGGAPQGRRASHASSGGGVGAGAGPSKVGTSVGGASSGLWESRDQVPSELQEELRMIEELQQLQANLEQEQQLDELRRAGAPGGASEGGAGRVGQPQGGPPGGGAAAPLDSVDEEREMLHALAGGWDGRSYEAGAAPGAYADEGLYGEDEGEGEEAKYGQRLYAAAGLAPIKKKRKVKGGKARSKPAARRAAEVYAAGLAGVTPVLGLATRRAGLLGAMQHMVQPSRAAVGLPGQPALNRALAAKLAHVFNLAQGGSEKHQAARMRVAEAEAREEEARALMRAKTALRQTVARSQRDAAARDIRDALEARAQAYEERVSELRMARLEAEWKAAERARRVRAAAQQEAALRQAFMEAVDAEKDALLALRREGRRLPAQQMKAYLTRLRHAEAQYLEMLALLEGVAAVERRGRLRAEQDAAATRRDTSAEVRSLRRQHIADTLARLAADEQAAYTRDALHNDRHVGALVAQLQRIISS